MPEAYFIKAIGRIRTDFKRPEDIIPSRFDDSPYHDPEVTGEVEVYDEYVPGLTGLRAGDEVLFVFILHKVVRGQTQIQGPHFDKPMGVYATRSPARPNRLAISRVKILEVREKSLVFQGVDMVDGSPLLDIKPVD